MYRTGDLLDHEIMRDDRMFSLLIIDEQGHRVVSDNGDIVSMRHNMTTNDPNISIGDIVTQTVTIEFALGIHSAGAEILKLNRSSKIWIYYVFPRVETNNRIPAGVFKVVDSTKKSNRLTVQARDFFYGMDRAYVSRLTYPTSITNVVQEIADQIGIPLRTLREPLQVLSPSEFENYEYVQDINDEYILVKSEGTKVINSKLEGYTLQQALSICAGYYGLSAYQDREGYLDFGCPNISDNGYYIDPDRADSAEFEKQVICFGKASYIDANGDKINIINYPSEEDWINLELVIDNPLIWDDPIDPEIELPLQPFNIAYLYYRTVYHSGKVFYRMGDPRLDIFDSASFFDDENGYVCVITSLDYYFDGGLSVTVYSSVGDTAGNISESEGSETASTRGVKATTKSAAESITQGGPMSQKIDRLQKQIDELKRDIDDIKRIITPKKEER